MTVPIMRDYRVHHSLRLGGRVVSQGTCELHLDDTFLVIKGDRSSRVGYEQLESFHLIPGGIELQLFPEGSARFDGMDGALVRPLFVHLSHLRGLRWACLLRYANGTPIDTLECKVELENTPEQEALFHLYPDGLVGMPYGGEPFELLMADLQSILRTPEYRLVCSSPSLVVTLYGCEPTYLGRFQRSVEAAHQKMEEETANLLVELFPALEISQLAALTSMLAGGRLASKSDLGQTVPWLWERIEEVVHTKGAYPEAFAALKERAGEFLWFGLRRLSEGDAASDQVAQADSDLTKGTEGTLNPDGGNDGGPPRDFLLWFLAGVKAGDRRFLAVEVDSGRKGYATYLYRCLDAVNDAAAFSAAASTISRAMVALNFYREPVYASPRDIESGRFAEYKLAVRKLQYLRDARALFVGRVIHSSPENWAAGLQALISSAGTP